MSIWWRKRLASRKIARPSGNVPRKYRPRRRAPEGLLRENDPLHVASFVLCVFLSWRCASLWGTVRAEAVIRH
ncbi:MULTISPECIES: hypothetical protein [unclassified Variovorax]|uniref:hypothetical protein n=1 Tax=unclassified Variovorax TaxID=663243 RepID=UPI00118020D6|nr:MULTISPECIES: hypothetical protein [unclassified Variovorax]QOF77657.1 hypothetical protein IG196_25480 [Variovorax sp. 38R]